MKGKFKKLAAAFAAVTVFVGSMPSMAFAAGSNYTGVSGGTVKFDKVLVVESDAKVPPVTFAYTINPGTAVPATDDTKLAVYAGVGSPTIGTAAYSVNDTADSPDDTRVFGTASDAYYTVKKDVSVNFGSVTFTEPGIYRYIIEETASNAAYGISDDVGPAGTFTAKNVELKRTLDVYVEDNGSGELRVTDYVLYEGTVTEQPTPAASTHHAAYTSGYVNVATVADGGDGANLGPKSNSYINLYKTHNLTIAKNVTGNQGSKDKYFAFTVVFTNAVNGTVYDVDITNADDSPAANAATTHASMSNPTSITISGETTATFYLQNGQRVVIKGIADGTQYSVEEDEEDYSPALLVTGDTDGTATNDGTTVTLTSGSGAADKYADTGITDNTSLTFTNTRSGVLPTGIIMSVAPAAIVGLGVLAAIIAMIVAGKRRAAEEE